MADFTSLKVGGPADVLLDAADAGDVTDAMRAAADLGVPYQIIGLGTNLVVRDGGIRGLVIRVGPRMSRLEWYDEAPAVTAGAGISLAGLAAASARRGYSGLEWAEGIPGTIGGAVVMNAGAYGGDMSENVAWVEVLETERPPGLRDLLATRRLEAVALDFGYRHSALQDGRYVVVAVHLRLGRDDPERIRDRMAAHAARRRERQPLEHPSAGSYFKRPPGRFAGLMVEECGLKGHRVGGAEVSRKHAGFIINTGQATAADILALAAEIQAAVRARFGVDLEPEVRIIGDQPGS